MTILDTTAAGVLHRGGIDPSVDPEEYTADPMPSDPDYDPGADPVTEPDPLDPEVDPDTDPSGDPTAP